MDPDPTNAEILHEAADQLKRALDWLFESELEQLATPEELALLVSLAQRASDALEGRRAR